MIPSPTKPIFMTPPARLGETRSPQTATVSAAVSSRAAARSSATQTARLLQLRPPSVRVAFAKAVELPSRSRQHRANDRCNRPRRRHLAPADLRQVHLTGE